MSLCMNSRCNGTTWLCGKCRKLYPSLAWSLDQKKRERNRNGSTMYDRSSKPRGASGGFNARTGKGHGTQYYSDNTRVSWDTDGQGDSNTHWTDQNKSKGSRRRHRP